MDYLTEGFEHLARDVGMTWSQRERCGPSPDCKLRTGGVILSCAPWRFQHEDSASHAERTQSVFTQNKQTSQGNAN